MTAINPKFTKKSVQQSWSENRRELENVKDWHRTAVMAGKQVNSFAKNIDKLSDAIDQLSKSCRKCADAWDKVSVKRLRRKSRLLSRMMDNYLADKPA